MPPDEHPIIAGMKQLAEERRRFDEKMQQIERWQRWIWFCLGFSVGSFTQYAVATWREVHARAAVEQCVQR